MEIDKRNIAFVVFFFAVGFMFILILYSISSKNNNYELEDKPKEEEKEEENELLADADVQTLFEIFSKLETDQDSLYLIKNKYYEESDLSNEEKLFVVVKTISYNDFINIDCGQLSDSLNVPSSFTCNKNSYGIHRGTISARYDEFFGYDKEIEYNDFLTYMYDPDLFMYIHFDTKDDGEDYTMPRAMLRDASIEDGYLIIKYALDYSGTGKGSYSEEIVLKFKKYNDHYIFVSKKSNIS